MKFPRLNSTVSTQILHFDSDASSTQQFKDHRFSPDSHHAALDRPSTLEVGPLFSVCSRAAGCPEHGENEHA